MDGVNLKDDDDFLTLVRKRYRLCVEADKDNRDRAKEALAFRNLDQWDDKTKNDRQNDPEGARPCLVVDKLNQHIQQVVNDERQNRPQIKVRPVDDKGDVEVAKIYDGIIRHIQDRSHADVAYDTGFECAVDGGFGWWRVLTEYCDPLSFEQDIRIKRVRNRFSVYLDPARQEPDGSDAKYGFILYRDSREDFKAEFKEKGKEALESFAHEGKEFTDWYGEDWVIYAEYFWIDGKKTTIVLLDDGTVMPKEEYKASGSELGIVRERETTSDKVRWRKLTATKILDDGEWIGNTIPIIEIVGNELDIEGRVYRSGMIRPAMDAQRVDNYATSAFVENVALAPRANYVAAQGQLEGNEDLWKSANRRNISVLPYKPVTIDGTLAPPPRREPAPGISPGWLSVLEQSEHNIQAAMGRYNASLGAPSNETSGKAINARNREGDTGSFHYADNLTRSLRHTGQMIVDIIPKIYDTQRIARIIGEDGEPGSATLDPNLKDAKGNPISYLERKDANGKIEKIYNLGVGKYDVTVTAGPSYTTRRLESADAMMEISRGNTDFMNNFGDIIFKSQDWPGAELIAERFKKMLPPNLTNEEEEADNSEAQIQQIQQAAQALGEKEAELTALEEQLTEQAKASAEAEQKAKDAMAKAQKEVEKVNTIMAAIENERELFDMQKKLAEKELQIQSTTLESERKIAQAELKSMQEKMDAKLQEINDSATESETKAQESNEVLTTLADLKKLVSAARVVELVLDEQGNPTGSVSRLQEQ